MFCIFLQLFMLFISFSAMAQSANNPWTVLPLLTVNGVATFNNRIAINGNSVNPSISLLDAGNEALGTPAVNMNVIDNVPSFSSLTNRFFYVFEAVKQPTGSNTTGSRDAVILQMHGVGGTSADFFTGASELAAPCLPPTVCNSFNLGGNFTSNNPFTQIPTGMTPQSAVSEEADIQTLSAPVQREGIRIADLGSTQFGSSTDAAIDIISTGVGFKNGIIFGDGGDFPIATGGHFISAQASSVSLTNFIDFSGMSSAVSGAQIALPAVGAICWGAWSACAGGQISSSTSTNGGILYFLNGNTIIQQGGINALSLTSTTAALAVPTTVTGDISTNTHYLNTSAVPTISACGTSPPAATAGSSNAAGQFTTGTASPTACTVTFAVAYPTTAFCSVTPAGTLQPTSWRISAQSKTAFTVTFAAGTSSQIFQYTCSGN